LVEVLADNNSTAHADGRVVQISYALAAQLSDTALAAVFAHELAHIALESRRRLSEAGVPDGLGREFGRYRRLARQAEVEADLLSVHLLANAGFDPQIAPQFWDGEAARVLGSDLFSSRIYPSHRSRARMMRAEIAAHLAGMPLPSAAQHLLAERDRTLSD
jgi:predicted Zn-dependent protease